MEGPNEGLCGTIRSRHPTHLLPTRSVCLKRCFRRRHLCLRISREEVLCSVELLSLEQETRGRQEQEARRQISTGYKCVKPASTQA